jgi:hypothetical protein
MRNFLRNRVSTSTPDEYIIYLLFYTQLPTEGFTRFFSCFFEHLSAVYNWRPRSNRIVPGYFSCSSR